MASGSSANSRRVAITHALRLLLFLSAVTSGIAADTNPPPEWSMSEEEATRLIERLNVIKAKVFELKSSGKLPGLARSDTGGELVILRIDEALKNAKILTARMREVVKSHKETYMVNVDFKNRKLRYLLASDATGVRLLSAFEEKEGDWEEIGQAAVTPSTSDK